MLVKCFDSRRRVPSANVQIRQPNDEDRKYRQEKQHHADSRATEDEESPEQIAIGYEDCFDVAEKKSTSGRACEAAVHCWCEEVLV